ncbi:cupin domain-containing protein [Enterovirga sp. CN4-39]|uniref:cupin domain-containing protein n=1 Tax=Enterovirga sp. CN4-39 TaxID=3400910 RepID=UPI003C09CC5B
MQKIIAALIGLFSASCAESVSAQDVTVTLLKKFQTTVAGQTIVAPSGPVEISVATYVILPGATLPKHHHDYLRFGYVLSGSLTVTNAATGTAHTFGRGEFIVEAIGLPHFAVNPGPDTVRLLLIDEAPADRATVVLDE